MLTCDDDPKIVFREESKHLDPNHDDAFVVFVKMINARGKRVMINICSLADILDAFKKLGLITNDLNPMSCSLTGFTGNTISPLSIINLHVTFEDELHSKTVLAKFMVVDIPSIYNKSLVDRL